MLERAERELVLAACTGDAYLYGLVLNDMHLVRGLLTGVADILALYPRPDHLRDAQVVAAARTFFELKIDWDFADPETGIIGAYLPDGDEDVIPRHIDYDALGCAPSRFDKVLRALGSAFDDEDELREAEAVVYGRIWDVAQAVRVAAGI